MCDQLDALMISSRADIAAKAAEWMDEEVARRADENPAAIQALGTDRIRALKVKLIDLRGAAAAVVTAETEDRTKWPHRAAPEATGSGSAYREPFFQAVFRTVISTLGPVLDQAGLITSAKGHVPSWERVSGGRIRYAINPEFEPHRSATVAEYHAVHSKYRGVVAQLNGKRAALEKAKARELWESA